MMKRFHILAVVLTFTATPVVAQEFSPSAAVPMSALAPADEYFGHYQMSVLGIANTLRDAKLRLEESNATPPSLINGPLAFVGDAIGAWEHKYPADPWIAKDLLALEIVYLETNSPDGTRRARETAAWLMKDYPATQYASAGQRELADASGAGTSDTAGYDPKAAWARFAALRSPLPPGGPH
jgi:hypothetical protein